MTRTGDGFSDALERLKRDGCTVLVTGEVPEPVSARATRKLLGTPTERRERVLVVTDAEIIEPATHLPGSLYPSHEEVTVFDHRDTSARDAPTGEPDPTDGECEAILEEVSNAIEPCTDGGDPEAAEVRVALVTLRALLDRHDRETVARLAEDLANVVEGVRGIGQCHLPIPDRSRAVRFLDPIFDARVELRQLDGMVPEQRWHIPKFDQRSEWVTL